MMKIRKNDDITSNSRINTKRDKQKPAQHQILNS